MQWKIPNVSFWTTGTTVNFSQLALCYMPSATPPWSSVTLIGVNAPYTSSVNRVINATASTGATVQCTINASGNWYIQLTSGTWPGRGTFLSGSYSL